MSAEIEKALKSRVVLLHGPESYLRDEALVAILTAAGIAKDDFDLEYFDGDPLGAGNWIASVGTAPFLADRRTVIVRHMYRSDPETVKPTQLQSLPDSALLVLVFDDEMSLDTSAAKTTKILNGWKKLVEGAKGTVLEFKIDAKSAKALVKNAVSEAGKTITDGAIDTLLEMSGMNISHARQELDKVFVYIGDAPAIRENDIRSVVLSGRDWNVFRMVDAIVASRPAEALMQLRILIGTPQKAEDAAFRSILPMVSRQLRLFWQGRLCHDARCAPASAPASILNQFPDKPNLAKEQPYRQTAIMSGARRVTTSQLTKCFAVLSDTDARLKGGLPGYTAVDTLERMVLEMCSELR